MTMKRFTKVSSDGYWKIKDEQADYKEILDLTNPQLIEDRLNQLNEENEQLKSKNRGLQSELQIFKEDATYSNLQINKLSDENEQLKQFKEDVFNKINMHLQMLPTARDNEFNEENGDPSLYSGAIYMLRTLKRRLEE